MTLVPWRSKRRDVQPSETRPLADLRGELDRMFDNLLRDPFNWPERAWGAFSRTQFPTIDVSENDREVNVRAELAGVDPEQIDVSLAGRVLTISGEKREASEKKTDEVYQSESRYGAFRRSIELPTEVDPDSVEASCQHGVLNVRISKAQQAIAKRVQVKVS